MNNFLNLQASLDYLTTNRPYFTQTWEFIAAAPTYLIPFQFPRTGDLSSDIPTIYTVDVNGVETDITDYFIDSTNLITDWTESGGSLTNTGPLITTWSGVQQDMYIESDTFALTAGQGIRLTVDPTAWDDPADYRMSVRVSGADVDSSDITNSVDYLYYTAQVDGDYSIRITRNTGGPDTVSNTTPVCELTTMCLADGNGYWWYNGGLLTSSLSGIFILKVSEANGDSDLFSDPIDPCGFTGKLKYKLSSDEDYGSIKYDETYAQWIYKDISVNRAPRADIEITGDSLNGEIVKEKTVSAVRFVLRMRVTELEYEAFVHSIGGDIEVTDRYGRVYDAQSVEITDPTWYRSNGVLEISFVDGNNVNVWSKNNSSL